MNYLFVGMGAVTIALAIPMILEKVPPNDLYGFRTPKTLSSPEIWYPANRTSGIDLALAGACIVIAALLFQAIGSEWNATRVMVANLGVTTVALTVAIVHSFVVLSKL